jgi:hypothetical protein
MSQATHAVPLSGFDGGADGTDWQAARTTKRKNGTILTIALF